MAAGRFTKSGPQFFYELPIIQAMRMIQAVTEQAKAEREWRKEK
ncbi:MAG: hypothetical protein ACLT46_12215 [Hungatella sp.]